MNPVFLELSLLIQALGIVHINDMVGCWEHDIGEGWRVAINGHAYPTRASNAVEVPAFHACVSFRGDTIGFVALVGVVELGVHEAPLIAALQRARERAKPTQWQSSSVGETALELVVGDGDGVVLIDPCERSGGWIVSLVLEEPVDRVKRWAERVYHNRGSA